METSTDGSKGRSLPEELRKAAADGWQGYVFHLERGRASLSSEELLDWARRGAAFLAERGVRPGDRVGVLGPNRPEWVRWAFATWFAGAAMVPVPLPLRVRDRAGFVESTRQILEIAGVKLLLAHRMIAQAMPSDAIVSWEFEPPAVPKGWEDPPVGPGDSAVIQFTSGSTSAPKGAVLTHAAVLAGIEIQAETLGARTDDVAFAWLPLFHDFGLFAHMLTPMIGRSASHLLPTERFAEHPLLWFTLATEVGATALTGPSSAIGAVLSQAARRPDGIDLSRVRCVIMGAEAINPAVVDRLRSDGPALGLRPEVLCAGYGMAEATLGLATGWPPGSGIRIQELDADRLAAGEAVPASDGRRTRRIVSCGRPVPRVEIRIMGDDEPLRERQVGEIQVKAPSLTSGYLGDVPQPFSADGWLLTGDLGFMDGGELFVTGRRKEIIIVSGRNYAPEEIEQAASRVGGLRQGRCLAFQRDSDGEGPVVVALELRPGADPEDVTKGVRQHVMDGCGVAVREVLLVPKGTIPKTTSGKLQRNAFKRAYQSGELDSVAVS